MASVDDIGSDTEQFFSDLAISAARRTVEVQKATGFCLWCEEPVSAGRRWCDSDCCGDFHKANR